METRQIFVKVPKDTYEDIAEAAKHRGLKSSQFIRMVVTDRLNAIKRSKSK